MSEPIHLSEPELSAAAGLARFLLARAEDDATVAFVAAVAVSGHLVVRGILEESGPLPRSASVVLSERANEVGPRLLERIVLGYRAAAAEIPRGDMYAPSPASLVRVVGAEAGALLATQDVAAGRRPFVAAESAVLLLSRLPRVSSEPAFVQSIASTLVETSKTWYGEPGGTPRGWVYQVLVPIVVMGAIAMGVWLFSTPGG